MSPSGCEEVGDDAPVTALPLFGARFALYGFADGRLVGADADSGAVRLRDPELPFLPRLFDASRRQLGAVPHFRGDAASFAEGHLEKFLPAVIPDLAREWKATGRWSLNFFAEHCGHVDVDVTLADGKKQRQPLREYLERARREPQAAYLRGWCYERDCPWLAGELWQPGDFHEVAFADSFGRLPRGQRPDFHWIFLGGRGAATPMHVDPTCTHAWLTQLAGRKRFVLFPPCDLQKLRRREGRGGPLLRLEEAQEMGLRGLEVVLEPGDTLFVPAFWAHHVECLEESVSLTWNFLGQAFFPAVRAAFLAHKLGTLAAT